MDLIGVSRISSDTQALAWNRQIGTAWTWHWVYSSLPEWRNGNLQYPRRVLKRGMVFVFTIGSALFSYRV